MSPPWRRQATPPTGASSTPNTSATTQPSEPPPWGAHQPGHQHHLHPRPLRALFPTPRPAGSSRPAARLRSGLPASPAATCASSSHKLGKIPGDISGGQIGYDLRRLLTSSSNASRTAATTGSPRTACPPPCSSRRLTRRVIIPALAPIADAGPPPDSPLLQAGRAYNTAIADLARHASLGIQPRPVTKRRSR